MARSYAQGPTLKLGAVDDVGCRNFPRLTRNVPGRPVADIQDDLHTLRFLLPKSDGVFGELWRALHNSPYAQLSVMLSSSL